MRLLQSDILEAAWSLVRKSNAGVRESHPRAYRWARAFIDAHQERERLRSAAADRYTRSQESPEMPGPGYDVRTRSTRERE